MRFRSFKLLKSFFSIPCLVNLRTKFCEIKFCDLHIDLVVLDQQDLHTFEIFCPRTVL